MDQAGMRSAHAILAEAPFEAKPIERGYANRTLYVDLSQSRIEIRPVDATMKELMNGGKGFDLYLMWHAWKGAVAWDDPKNELCIATGPLGGTPAFSGTGKSLVTGISPLTGSVMDCNVGGHFGPLLKCCGFDALEIQGKASAPCIVLIDGKQGLVRIESAPQEPWNATELVEVLHRSYADAEDELQAISVVCAGEGARHTRMGCLNFSWWDWKRNCARVKQAGRGGMGTVFTDKNIKALVAKHLKNRPLWQIRKLQKEARA